MWNPLKFALLLAALLAITAGTAWAQADEPEDQAPMGEDEESDEGAEMEQILRAVFALTKDARITEADVKLFVEHAGSFDEVGNDSDLEERLDAAVKAGRPFAEVILAHPDFKAWVAERNLEGLRWLQSYFRINIILTRTEMAAGAEEMQKSFDEDMESLAAERGEMGEEMYAELKQNLESAHAEQVKANAIWVDEAPKPTEEEALLLKKYDAEIKKATGRGDYEDVPGGEVPDEMRPGDEERGDEMAPDDEPGDTEDEDPFGEEEEEDYTEQLGRVISAIAAFTKDVRLTEASLAKFIDLWPEFEEMSEGSELEGKLEDSIRAGEPFADVVLADESYREWADSQGVDRLAWLQSFLRVQILLGRREAMEHMESNRTFHEERLKELEAQRAEMDEEEYRQELAWIEESRADDEKFAKIWAATPTPTEEETKLLTKYRKEIRKAMGQDDEESDMPDDDDPEDQEKDD